MAPIGRRYPNHQPTARTFGRRPFVTRWSTVLVIVVCLATSLGAVRFVVGADPYLVRVGTTEFVFGQLRGFADRRKAEDLLKRARKAIDDGKLELAQWYADRADKLGIDFDTFLGRMSDTPTKIRDDVRKARVNLETLSTLHDNTGRLPNEASRSSAPSQQFTPQTTSQPSYVDGTAARVPTSTPNYAPTVSPNDQLDAMVDTPKARAVDSLRRAREALNRGNRIVAVGWYQNALATGANFSPDEYGPQQLAGALSASGVEDSLLVPPAMSTTTESLGSPMDLMDPATLIGEEMQLPAFLAEASSAPPRQHVASSPDPATESTWLNLPTDPATESTWLNPPAAESAGLNPPADSDRHAQVLQLLSAAQATMDRGNLEQAQRLALTAQSLGVPDSEYSEGEPRPWMLLLDVSKKLSRQDSTVSTTVPDGPGQATVSDIMPASFEDAIPSPQAPLDTLMKLEDPSMALPAPNKFPIIPGQLNDPSALPLTPFQANAAPVSSSPAYDLFTRGEEALTAHDIGEARELFREAWQVSDKLDPETRQRLSDHLQVIGSTELMESIQPGPLATESDGAGNDEKQYLRQLISEIGREQAAARNLKDKNPTQAWEKLKEIRVNIGKADVNIETRQQLLVRIDRSIADIEAYIDQNRPMIELDQRNRAILEQMDREKEQKIRNQQKLAEFVEKFNQLMDEERFPDAKVIAKQARQLDPNNPVVENMIWKASFAQRIVSGTIRKNKFQNNAAQVFQDVDDSGVPIQGNLEFPDAIKWEALTNSRKRLGKDKARRFTEVELEIQQALKRTVDVRFDNLPLSAVIDSLAKMAGVNAFLDPAGLANEGVGSDNLVSIQLRKPVSLRSALNLILEPLHLSYVIQNEVLRITSEQERSGDVYSDVYPVADLVIPIPNFLPDGNIGLPGAIRAAHEVAGRGFQGGVVQNAPFTLAAGDQNEKAANQSVLAQMGATNLISGAPSTASPFGFGAGGTPQGGGAQADFETLIDLITSTIEPDSWEDVGTGTGSIRGFDTNLSLVVSNTQEVHEKIADLLAQLRRLQDLQVTIEVRFITISDDFFERIGVDFDFNVDDNSGLSFTEVLERQTSDSGPSITVGLDPVTGSPTSDLDVQFNQGSFAAAIPQFGGFDANAAASVGFAILSDIEAFFVIEALQGDERTNVLQAPKVTLFNGQTATVSDNSQRPFVTSVIPVVGDFAAAHQPVITVLSEGTTLSVQAVVSNDRRFVRLTLVPFFSRIGDVDTFTFDGSTTSSTGTTAVDPTDDTRSNQDNALITTQGTTVQLPTFAFTTVNTTVSVPDGGTILLGGIKRLAEGRNERGVPILSKLPYINRLFRNVGIGRETESLMMMVTPRIIIQEEEEEKLGLAL